MSITPTGCPPGRVRGTFTTRRTPELLAESVASNERRRRGDQLFSSITYPTLIWIFSLLINNVGMNIRKPTLEYSEGEYRSIIENSMVSTFEMCRLAHAHLREHGNAAIVNVGSVSAARHPHRFAVRHEQGWRASADAQFSPASGRRTASA